MLEQLRWAVFDDTGGPRLNLSKSIALLLRATLYALWSPRKVLLPILSVIVIRLFEKYSLSTGKVPFGLEKEALRSFFNYVLILR